MEKASERANFFTLFSIAHPEHDQVNVVAALGKQ